jgi:hypothetical protein
MRLKFILLFLLMPLARGQQQMSHEEQVVRMTYAKLSYAIQVEEVSKIIFDSKVAKKPIDRTIFSSRLKAAELRFELSDFKTGNLSAISQTKYSDLVTKPEGGPALAIGAGIWKEVTDDPKETKSDVASARWGLAQTLTENWDVPFGEVYPQMEVAGQHNRFAAYKVTVSFQGRSLEYRAMFLFGTDAQGQETVLPIDTTSNLNGSALNAFLKRNAYPETLIEGGLGKDPVIYEWLSTNQVSQSPAKRHEAICDPVTLTCGVHSDDLKKLKASPKTLRVLPMQRHLRLVPAAFHPPAPFRPMMMQATDCSAFNTSTSTPRTQSDGQFHISGLHSFTALKSTGCFYTNGNNSNGLCNTECDAPVDGFWTETGLVSSFCHQTGKAFQQGGANATAAGASCTGGAGGGVQSCAFCGCNVTVSVSVIGGTVSASSTGFLTVKDQDDNTCGAQTQPTPTPTPPPPPPPDPGGCNNVGGDGFNPVDGGAGNDGCSPIIVDLTGDGFVLTDAQHGVMFDITGTGHPLQMAWTANSNNAFLVLDRNGSGTITNGAELFGNFTAQPSSPRPNGFAALAVYDDPANGGNGDGVIDARDKIFSSLRLWVDTNHDGISQPGELHTLPDLGIFSISLDYSLSERTDEYGNVFRYKAHVNQGLHGPSDVGKTAYDVFLVAQ